MPDSVAKYLNKTGLETYNESLPHSATQMQAYVNDWLDVHPEATTTVEDNSINTDKIVDGAITNAKLSSDGILPAFTYSLNEHLPTFTSGGYIATNGATADVSNVVERADMSYIVEPCKAYDIFYIKGLGWSYGRLWAFVDENGNVLSKASSSYNAADFIEVVAPQNAAYAVFNVQSSQNSQLLVGETVHNHLSIREKGNLIELCNTDKGYVDISGNVAAPTANNEIYTPYYIPTDNFDIVTVQAWSTQHEVASWGCIACYDENKTFINRVGFNITYDENNYFLRAVSLLANTKYIRVCHRTKDVIRTMFNFGGYPLPYSPSRADITWLYGQKLPARVNDIEAQITNIKATGLNNALLRPASAKFAMHRGLQSEAPENSVPAFELAGQNSAWGIETDIYETVDGYFVCMHDATVDRTTDGTGNIQDMTLAQVQALTIDVGSNIELYPDLKVPTMREYLNICRRYGCVALVEVKGITNVDAFVNEIKAAGMITSCVILITYSSALLSALRTYTSAPIALIGSSNTPFDAFLAHTTESYDIWLDLYSLNAYQSQNANIDAAHAANVPCMVWVTDSTTYAENAIAKCGIDVVTSNSITSL